MNDLKEQLKDFHISTAQLSSAQLKASTSAPLNIYYQTAPSSEGCLN